MSQEPLKYNALVNMNKPVYFRGFSSLQLLFVAVTVGLSTMLTGMLVSWLVAFIVVPLFIIFPLGLVMKVIGRQNKEGNPDFMDSYIRFLFLKKKFEDESDLFKYLRK